MPDVPAVPAVCRPCASAFLASASCPDASNPTRLDVLCAVPTKQHETFFPVLLLICVFFLAVRASKAFDYMVRSGKPTTNSFSRSDPMPDPSQVIRSQNRSQDASLSLKQFKQRYVKNSALDAS